MIFTEFRGKVITWAKERRIIPNSSLEAQNLKLAEEFGELADGLRKGNMEKIKDSVGDVAVVVTIMAGLMGAEIDNLPDTQSSYYANKENLQYSFMWLQADIGEIAKYIIRDKNENLFYSLANVISDLQAFCKWQGIEFMDCCELAWDEIKDRKGYLNEQGIFIKEEDYAN